MIPGEVITQDGEITLNAGRDAVTLAVANTGDRPVQIGSHYHFYETNEALAFDRAATRGRRLDIPAGTAVRFEPGESKTVNLVAAPSRALDFDRAVAAGMRLDIPAGTAVRFEPGQRRTVQLVATSAGRLD